MLETKEWDAFSVTHWGFLTPAEDTWDCFSGIKAAVPIVRIYLGSGIWLFLMGENFSSNALSLS